MTVVLYIFSSYKCVPEFTSSGAGANCIGFQVGSAIVSIIAAKMSTRYRLQSDSIFPLALLVKQLITRLESSLKSSAQETSLKVTASSPPPVEHLFSHIEKHIQCRKLTADLKVRFLCL